MEYESGRVYLPEKRYTTVTRKTIGKLTDADNKVMQPNENFLKFFPDTILPEEKDRAQRSCALRAGTWIVIRKIVNDYHLPEILGRYLSAKDVGLFLDLCAYSITEEDNRAQHYPSYAYSHPLFTEGMRIYSDSKVSDFLQSMDREVSIAFQNDWNRERDHREKIYISYDSTSKRCEAGDLRIVEMGHSKENTEANIFNYAIAYDTANREPLFYELYPGSINDLLFPQFMKEDTEREKGLKMETGPAPLRESDPITHYLFFSFQISFSYSRIVRSEEKNPAFAILTSIFFSQAVLSSISFRSFSLVLQ